MIIIWQMKADDIEDVAILCDQLGYLPSVSSVATRFEKINKNTDHVLLVRVDPYGKCSTEKQIERIWLHSNVVREDAHHFYRLIGFHSEKTSLLLEKRLLG
jgi:hypothetical protein